MAVPRLFIPEPQSVIWRGESFAWRQGLSLRHHPLSGGEAGRLADWLGRVKGPAPFLVEDDGLPLHGLAILAGGAAPPGLAHTASRAEGYHLEVSGQGILLIGTDQPGLFYGVQTLRQLAEPDGPVPGVCIEDWPALRIRGVHLDLKGCMPTTDYLRMTFAELARYKINTVLLEYEDKFPFTGRPEIRSTEALMPEELRDLLSLARECHIQVIPLVQSLGHVEYILRHERYAHLREDGAIDQYCPLNPGSLALFREMLDEVLAYHQDAAYVHIGADEARRLGSCPACREKARREGKAALYLDYLNECLRHVQSLGKKPIIWDDMVWNESAPEIMDRVQPGAVACDWFYNVTTDEVPFVFWQGGHLSSRRWLELDPTKISPWKFGRFLEDLPPEEAEVMGPYWDRGHYPLWCDALPLLGFLRDRGLEVIGASCAKGATASDSLTPDWRVQFGNVTLWARRAAEAGILGVIATAWSRFTSLYNPCEPWEYGWYTALASADYCWHPRPADREEFDRRYNHMFLGLEGGEITRAMRVLEAGGAAQAAVCLLEGIRGRGVRPAHTDALLAAAKIAAHQAAARFLLAELDGRAYLLEEGRAPPAELRALAGQLRSLLAAQPALAAELEKSLLFTLRAADAREVAKTQLHGLLRRLESYLALTEDPPHRLTV